MAPAKRSTTDATDPTGAEDAAAAASASAGASSPATRRGRRQSPQGAAPSDARAARQGAGSSSGRHQRRPLALVTGATSGIGLAVARDLARDHDLVLVARTAKDLEELAAVLTEETGARVRTCPLDLTDDDAVASAVEDLALDCLDVLVHSAGVEAAGRVDELTPAQWRAVLDLDLVAVAHLTSLLLAPLRASKGLVIMVNSGAGLRTWPGQALYCAAKSGLKALADTLREEERGAVRVTTVYPGRVDTPMQKRIHRENSRRLRQEGERTRRYRAADHMAPTSVASTVRLAVDMPLDAVIEDLSVRPGGML